MNKLIGVLLACFVAGAAMAQVDTRPRTFDSGSAVPKRVERTTTTQVTDTTAAPRRVVRTRTTTTRTTRAMGNTGEMAGHPGKACPPGLAKKNNGCMPPGLAKKRPRD